MIAKMRSRLGAKTLATFVVVISVVFIFWGVFPSARDGGMSASDVGSVNGEIIPYREFSRAVQQRTEMFRSMMGGKMDEDVFGARIRESVFQELAQQRVLAQKAKDFGFYPSSEEIREAILKTKEFSKEGRFDKILYKNLLQANGFSPARYEELVGEGIMVQKLRAYLTDLPTVSEFDVDQSLKNAKERRKILYVFFDHEILKKQLKDVKPENQKEKLDQLIQEWVGKIQAPLAQKNAKSVDSALKSLGIGSKVSDWLNKDQPYLPGVGSVTDVVQAAFSGSLAQPQLFPVVGGAVYAVVTQSEGYDVKKVTAKDRVEQREKLVQQKQSEIFSSLFSAWMKSSKITKNDALVAGKSAPGGSPTQE